MTLEEKLTASESRLAQLLASQETLQSEIADLRQRLAVAEKAHGAAAANAGRLEAELASSRQDSQALAAQLAKLQAEARSAEARAAQICASVGVTPLPVTPQGDKPAPTTARERWAQQFSTNR